MAATSSPVSVAIGTAAAIERPPVKGTAANAVANSPTVIVPATAIFLDDLSLFASSPSTVICSYPAFLADSSSVLVLTVMTRMSLPYSIDLNVDDRTMPCAKQLLQRLRDASLESAPGRRMPLQGKCRSLI